MKKAILTNLFLSLLIGNLSSQTCFTAGTGVDGAYTASANTSIVGGTYNFTTFNIDPGVTVNVTGTQPLIIYSTGNVTINGSLTANGGNGGNGVTYVSGGNGGIGVAGGANGGVGSFASGSGPITAFAGSGAGGVGNQGAGWSGGGGAGYALMGSPSDGVGGFGGPIYGDANITLLESGSGGGGGSGGYDCGAGGGGAGGGVIVIQSTASIIIGATGSISANGGNGGSDGTGNCGGGGGGSGGAIYLAAPSVTNDGVINSLGGLGGASMVPGSPYYGTGGNGSVGRIRVDHNGSILGSGTTVPSIGAENPLNIPPVFTAISFPNDSICSGGSVTLYGNGDAASYLWSGGITDSVSFIPAGIVTYTVTASSAGGCTSTSSITVNVMPLPTPSATNTGPYCEGTTIQLNSPAGSATDDWTGPLTYSSTNTQNPTIASSTISMSGDYTVTVTNGAGCSATATTTVVVNAQPSVNLGADVVQPNPPAVLNAGAGFASYLWSTTETTQTISVTTNGQYIVTVTAAGVGCSDSDTINVNFTSGVVNVDGSVTNISLYPNPTSNGIFNVSIENIETSNLVMEVLDVNGSVVHNKYIGSVNGNIIEPFSLTDLSIGIYIMKITMNDKSIQMRFIINK